MIGHVTGHGAAVQAVDVLNKENNVFKDAIGVKGLGFKLPFSLVFSVYDMI